MYRVVVSPVAESPADIVFALEDANRVSSIAQELGGYQTTRAGTNDYHVASLSEPSWGAAALRLRGMTLCSAVEPIRTHGQRKTQASDDMPPCKLQICSDVSHLTPPAGNKWPRGCSRLAQRPAQASEQTAS